MANTKTGKQQKPTDMTTDNDNSKDDSHLGDQSWIERNVNVFIWALVVACIATLVAQLVFWPMFNEKHPAHFEVETIFGFEAIFGFVAFIGVVFLGWLLRFLVKRDEDYYDS